MIVGHIGGGAVDQGYAIEKSLRTRGNSGNRLSRTFGARTSGTTGTLSMWIKRGKLGVAQFLLAGSNGEFVQFLADDTLRVSNPSGTPYWVTSKKFRDPSAHMHLHIAWDTTQAVAANRCRVWVNLEEITEWSSKPDITQNSAFAIWNSNGNVGTLFGSAYFDQNFDGLGSEIHWLDGQYLLPTEFAELDANGVCVPKEYTGGNYGNNGFFLDFEDGTSLTTLGYDKSGNNNHWTLNGYSLTAGATYDWMDDTPTNNFAVLNPLSVSGVSPVVDGGLRFNTVAGTYCLRATQSIKVPTYFEFAWGSVGLGIQRFGVATNQAPANTEVGSDAFGWALRINNAGGSYGVWHNNTLTSTGYSAGNPTDVGMCAVDPITGKIWWGRNGTWFNSGNPAAGTNAAYANIPTEVFPAFSGNTWDGHLNFGQRPFAYTPPTGFKALCTKNRPLVTITDPRQHHTVITVTKSGDTNFTLPWNATDFDTLFWIKRRDAAGDWYQIDGLRGYDKILKSNSAAAETTDANVLGVSGTTCTLKSTLPNGTYVIYAWKAGLASARQTNTDGTITSTVSANVAAGFSIVTYTGTGVAGTVGHGLGNVPKMTVCKDRNSGATGWIVYHSAVGHSNILLLNDPSSPISLPAMFNNSPPTSTVLNIGGQSGNNFATRNHVTYCHAEVYRYSKFGSYTGNGSADGPFIASDMSVMSLLTKRGNWCFLDTARNQSNQTGKVLYPNLPDAEANYDASRAFDFLSNGSKVRTSHSEQNASGGVYIYAAYAKHPFGGDNVNPAPAR